MCPDVMCPPKHNQSKISQAIVTDPQMFKLYTVFLKNLLLILVYLFLGTTEPILVLLAATHLFINEIYFIILYIFSKYTAN